MATWNSRGLRGSTLEDMINVTIEQLREQKLALIQKVPTPITPIEIDQASRHITLAYFDQKSTVDYLGVVQGVPVCFDAKECAKDTFPLQNLHAHQVDFMRAFEAQEGVAFLLIYFTERRRYYYMRFAEMMRFWERMEAGGRKSFLIEELDDRFFIEEKGPLIPILEAMQIDLSLREDADE